MDKIDVVNQTVEEAFNQLEEKKDKVVEKLEERGFILETKHQKLMDEEREQYEELFGYYKTCQKHKMKLKLGLEQRDDQYKELLNENEILESELREKANEFKILEFIAGGAAEDNAAMEKEIIEVYEINEELDRKLKWVDKNLTEKLIELNRYGKLVDDLMKVVDILSSRVEGDE